MPHVSQKNLKRKTLIGLSHELFTLIAELESGAEAKTLLNELLTETELIMIAKRLAILLMLKRGYSFYAIANTLHISPSTAERYWKATKRKSFDVIIRRLERGRKGSELLDLLFPIIKQNKRRKHIVKSALYINQ
jgi:uncharacterized protein YerC